MRPFQPALGELDPRIPIFPLGGAMLLPYGRMPLNVFEPRYLALIDAALANGRMFGMIQPDILKPEVENGPSLFGIGCLGRITSFTETDDGRIIISVLGVIRFAVTEELETRQGYRQVMADFSPYAQDLQPEAPEIGLPRKMLLDTLRGYFDRQSLSVDWDAIGEMDDPTLLTALCMMCPFTTSEKQALLEAEPLASRAEILLALLEIGMHGSGAEAGARRLS
ncbi:LON peptidase substrate-binding domain-containing protein [Acidisoma cladoniae]|uniref:LON peptidase substrate-binding domain-containing protein n=1 Tax=Acidisoma cladoniae TaxID=3040935 RepID=UPI00254A14DE|nr:LON peptidase substrate-binding domain-containing protein [Acidisoma sp. PAMC 29798]